MHKIKGNNVWTAIIHIIVLKQLVLPAAENKTTCSVSIKAPSTATSQELYSMDFHRNHTLPLVVAILWFALFWSLLACNALAVTTHPQKAQRFHNIRLFDTIAFRGSQKALPNWTRVLAIAKRQTDAMMACKATDGCSSATQSWQHIQKQVAGLPRFEQLKKVNAYFNRWPYRPDQDVYGKSDYWATPQEFLQSSGDCEDYSICKYYALKQLGIDDINLRIVVLTDTIRNVNHAVLAVSLEEDTYILDNITDLVYSHTRYKHYLPHYSVNERYRWAHVRPIPSKNWK